MPEEKKGPEGKKGLTFADIAMPLIGGIASAANPRLARGVNAAMGIMGQKKRQQLAAENAARMQKESEQRMALAEEAKIRAEQKQRSDIAKAQHAMNMAQQAVTNQWVANENRAVNQQENREETKRHNLVKETPAASTTKPQTEAQINAESKYLDEWYAKKEKLAEDAEALKEEIRLAGGLTPAIVAKRDNLFRRRKNIEDSIARLEGRGAPAGTQGRAATLGQGLPAPTQQSAVAPAQAPAQQQETQQPALDIRPGVANYFANWNSQRGR